MRLRVAVLCVTVGFILCAIGIFLLFRVIETTTGLIFCVILLAIASLLIESGFIGGIVGMSMRAQERRREKYDREHPKKK